MFTFGRNALQVSCHLKESGGFGLNNNQHPNQMPDKVNPNGYAFPTERCSYGITTRTYIASKMMAAIVTGCSNTATDNFDVVLIAKTAAEMADALIRELNK
jgi:hypothetical protein